MLKEINSKFLAELLPKRSENSNKATFGKVLNISGSKNFIGASYLSSISALKMGAGYVTLAAPKEIIPIVASLMPEVTFIYLNSTDDGTISNNNDVDNFSNYNVVSMGCGITQNEQTSKFFFKVLNNLKKTQNIVIDADGINILSKCNIDFSIKNAVITPHPKELSRLLNVSIDEILSNREKFAMLTSKTYECITVLKGHNTIISDGNNNYVNSTGSSALAKAGSGDVLTGIIAGLLAQGVKPLNAALLGVYLHGLSGDIASSSLTKYSVLATDVINNLPFAINKLILQE
jgi:NAD(P)H-hydrate epimerase